MNSRKKRIVVYIAAAVVILIISSALVLKKTNNKEILLDKLELGQQYLVELDYSSAVLKFTDAIKIEPKSEDAYVGLADAYSGMGETDKAIEALEEGYVKTGNENFLDMIESFKQSAEAQTAAVETTAVQTTTAPPETTTMQTTTAPPETTTVQSTTVPSETTTFQATTAPPETTTVQTTTAPPETTTVQTTTAAKVNENYLFTAPDPKKVEFMSGNFKESFVTENTWFTPDKDGMYGFEYYTDNEMSKPCLYVVRKSPYFSCGVQSCGGYSLVGGEEYQIYIKEESTRLKRNELTYGYKAYMYIPTDPCTVEGSFSGNLLYKGQQQKYYFTPNVTAEYTFDFSCSDGVNAKFEYGRKDDSNLSQQSMQGSMTKKLDAGVTYVFTVTGTSQTTGGYTVKIS